MGRTDFDIAGRKISQDAPPLLIAEMSGNHNHSLERALEIVDAAARCGAHALKIQTYTADTHHARSSSEASSLSRPEQSLGRPVPAQAVRAGVHALGVAPGNLRSGAGSAG